MNETPGQAVNLTPASPSSVSAFLAIVVLVVGCYGVATWYAAQREGGAAGATRAVRRFVLGTTIWLGVFALVVQSGAIASRPFPLIPVVFGAVNLGALAFGLSRAGETISRHVPIQALVAFQGFRLPLELVLHAWSEQGTIPATMTWTGSNLDILSGIVALALAPVAAHRAAAWAANLVGAALLINVARVAMLSSPLPFAWDGIEPRLTLIAHLPYAFIGPVCVAGALAGHVILTRRLLRP